MSADDFQTKYASVMESMLKSAIAETTKLFENMVDELKAEISQIKKENEDLKSKCFQYEVAKTSQQAEHSNESDTSPVQSDDSVKCDSGVQCDLAPYRTVLVEQCQPLVESPQQNQEQPCTQDRMGYTWQEHNYVSNRARNSKAAFVHVKQEESDNDSDFLQSSLKQEEDESDLVSCQVLTKTRASVAEVECEELRISKGSSTKQIPSSQASDVGPPGMQLPCLRTNSSFQVAQNQPPDLNHSLVISLTDALREDIKEEHDIYQMTTKMGTSEDLTTQKQQLIPEEHDLDKASLLDEQTEVTGKHGDVTCTNDHLAESELIGKEVVCEELANVDPKPNLTKGCRKGRQPKNSNEKQFFPSKVPRKVGFQAVNTSLSNSSGASASEVLETSSIFSLPVERNANTSTKENINKAGSLKQSPSKPSQLFIEVEKKKTQVRVFRASSGCKTANPPQSESPQPPSGLMKEGQTSVSLQDAMLLIEAMNQSTPESTFSLTQATAQTPTHSAPLVGPTETPATQQVPPAEIHHTTNTLDVSSNMTGTGLSNDTMLQNAEIIPKKPQHMPVLNNATMPVLSALSSTAAAQTVMQSLPLPRIKVGPPTNAPRTIIILPRPALSYASHNTIDMSKTHPSTVDSATSQKILTVPPVPSVELSCGKPSNSSIPPKTIKVSYRKLDHGSPLQSTTILADHQLMISANKKVTIVPKSLVAVKRDISEKQTPINNPELFVPTNTPEPDVSTGTPETVAYPCIPEPIASTGTPEPEAHVNIPEPEAHVNIPEPEADINIPKPETLVNTPEQETHVDTPEPEAHVDAPEPEALNTPETEALNTPEPEALNTPEPEALDNTPEPEGLVNTHKSEALIDTPGLEACVDTPEPEACINTPGLEACVNTPGPGAYVNTPEPYASLDTPEPDTHVSPSTQLSFMSQEPSLIAANETLLPKKNNTTSGPNYSTQSAAVFEAFNPLTDISSSTEMSVKEVQTIVSSVLPSTTDQKFRAVVRLTRLPFPVSTKESFSVSALLAKGFSFVSEKQSKPSISLSVVSDMKAARGSQPLASNITELPFEPITFNQLTVDLGQDTILNEDEEDQKEGLVLPMSVNPDDISDPRLKITKMEFLQQLHILHIKSSSNKRLDASQKSSIVSRLRSHLKPLLKARRSATEQVTDNQTESGANNQKRPRLDSDSLNVKNTAEEPVSFRKPGVSDVTALNAITYTRQCQDNASPTKIVCENVFVSLKKFDSDAESFTMLSSNIDVGSTPQRKSSSTGPKRSTKSVGSPENTTNVKENDTNLGESGSPSCSPFIKVSPCTSPIKRESSSFSPRRCSITKVNAINEKNTSETHSPLTKGHKKAKITSPERARKLTPEKRAKLFHRCQSTKTNHSVKLPKTARARRRNRIKSSNLEKLKRQNKINNGVVKKCSAKIWYPPTLPPDEVPSTEIIKAPRLKVEYRVPVIPLNPEPIVSPLQPLAFIGRHLLRNQCGECGRVFNSSNALESHVSLHNLNRPFTCKLCAKYFPDAITFKRHDRVHRNGRIHVCPTCGKGFVYRFGLSKHVQMVHGNIRPFNCQVCNKGFFNKRDVEIHTRIHTGEKPFQCDICERRFTRKVELNVHLRWHNGEKRHWCSYCGKGFLDANNLKRHKYTHTGEKPFSCPFCPKSFTQTGHQKKHIESMHGDARI